MRKPHVPGSEDDEMHEFEKNTEDTGEHSPHLLEEEEEEIKEDVKDEEEKDTEEDMIVTEQITSRLTELLQVIPPPHLRFPFLCTNLIVFAKYSTSNILSPSTPQNNKSSRHNLEMINLRILIFAE